MEGALDLAEELFHMPVRLGTPQHVTGLADAVASPMQSTGVGLPDLRQPPRRRARGASPHCARPTAPCVPGTGT